jgi:hypothetical protein
VTAHNLERVRRIKGRLVRLSTRVETVGPGRAWMLEGKEAGLVGRAPEGCAARKLTRMNGRGVHTPLLNPIAPPPGPPPSPTHPLPHQIREVLEGYLDDDQDMHAMNISAKEQHALAQAAAAAAVGGARARAGGRAGGRVGGRAGVPAAFPSQSGAGNCP